MVAGPAGLRGHRALGIKGHEVVPALIPSLGMGGSTVLEKQLRRLTVKTKSCNT